MIKYGKVIKKELPNTCALSWPNLEILIKGDNSTVPGEIIEVCTSSDGVKSWWNKCFTTRV